MNISNSLRFPMRGLVLAALLAVAGGAGAAEIGEKV
jgi:hypothetical protein